MSFGGSPPTPAPPPPVPTREDPAVEESKKKLRMAERQRSGRRASILTGGQGVMGEAAATERPEARSAALLGG
jgi:type IV secretory pathway VirB10-like protein